MDSLSQKKWKEFDGLSVAGFFTVRYGRDIGQVASCLLLVAMLGFCAAYIKSLTLLFAPLVPSLAPWILGIVMWALILAMVLRGGLIAIIRTDLLSLVCMLIFFPLIAWFMWKSPTLPPLSYQGTFAAEGILPVRFVFSLTILTMFTYILAPWYGQKIFAARDSTTARRSVLAAAVLTFVLYGSAIVATAFFRYRGFECASIEAAFPSLIDRCLSPGIRGFAYALLFVTSATTLGGVWNAMSAMWIGDFSRAQPASSFKRSLRITLLFSLASLLLATTLVDKVFDKLILANIPIAALSFGLLAGFYWKRASRQGVIVSIVMGCLCGLGAYLIFGEEGGYTWYWAVYGIPLIFLTGTIASIFRPLSHIRSIR